MRPQHEDMTPADLVLWRALQPGEYACRNNQHKPGWSQLQAAKWYGVTERTWQRYEAGESVIPLPLFNRLMAYEASFEDMISRLWETTPEKVEEYSGIFPRLADEGREIDL